VRKPTLLDAGVKDFPTDVQFLQRMGQLHVISINLHESFTAMCSSSNFVACMHSPV
jgi:hypothetical protein